MSHLNIQTSEGSFLEDRNILDKCIEHTSLYSIIPQNVFKEYDIKLLVEDDMSHLKVKGYELLGNYIDKIISTIPN